MDATVRGKNKQRKVNCNISTAIGRTASGKILDIPQKYQVFFGNIFGACTRVHHADFCKFSICGFGKKGSKCRLEVKNQKKTPLDIRDHPSFLAPMTRLY